MPDDPNGLTCDRVTWETVGPAFPGLPGLTQLSPLAQYFNRGQRTWPLIVRNNAAAGAGWASACPTEATAVAAAPPVTRELTVRARNRYGSNVVNLRLRLMVESGADGSIARFTMAAVEVSATWGRNVSVSVAVLDPLGFTDGGRTAAVLPVEITLMVET